MSGPSARGRSLLTSLTLPSTSGGMAILNVMTLHRLAQRLESQRFPRQIVFPCRLAAPVHRGGQCPDEGQVAVPLSIVKAVPDDELVADVEPGVGHVHVHLEIGRASCRERV